MIKITQSSVKTNLRLKKSALLALKKLNKREDLGFLRLPFDQEVFDQCQKLAQTITKNFKQVMVLGMGGSSLGGRVLKDFSLSESVDFFENVDGDYLLKKVSKLNLTETHWILISKSGSTIELLSQITFLTKHYKESGLEFTNQCTVLTELKPSPLYDWAKKNQIMTLEIPQNVGGRYSVLSSVGLLPAAIMGLDIIELSKGAKWALKQNEIICHLVAQTLQSWKRKEWITVFWIYSDFLYQLGPWLQQLWSESLAKKKTRKNKIAPRVSTPLGLKGTQDQHSMLQQLMEGYKDKFVWFIKSRPDSKTSLNILFNIEADSTQEALDSNRVKTLVMTLEEISVASLGALFMLTEIVVAVLGEILDIDAFNQPGVELGKRLTKQRLIELDK